MRLEVFALIAALIGTLVPLIWFLLRERGHARVRGVRYVVREDETIVMRLRYTTEDGSKREVTIDDPEQMRAALAWADEGGDLAALPQVLREVETDG